MGGPKYTTQAHEASRGYLDPLRMSPGVFYPPGGHAGRTTTRGSPTFRLTADWGRRPPAYLRIQPRREEFPLELQREEFPQLIFFHTTHGCLCNCTRWYLSVLTTTPPPQRMRVAMLPLQLLLLQLSTSIYSANPRSQDTSPSCDSLGIAPLQRGIRLTNLAWSAIHPEP